MSIVERNVPPANLELFEEFAASPPADEAKDDVKVLLKELGLERPGRLRRAGSYIAKIGVLAIALGGVGYGLINHASDKADEQRVAWSHVVDEKLNIARDIACSTGKQLIVTFNDVSVDPLKDQIGGVNRNTGTIAQQLMPSTTTTTTQPSQDQSPSTTVQLQTSPDQQAAPPDTHLDDWKKNCDDVTSTSVPGPR